MASSIRVVDINEEVKEGPPLPEPIEEANEEAPEPEPTNEVVETPPEEAPAEEAKPKPKPKPKPKASDIVKLNVINVISQ